MYSRIVIDFFGSIIFISTFGLMMMLAWVVFFWGLHYFSMQKNITKHVFTRLIPFTLSIYIFARMFYFFTEWRDAKFFFEDAIHQHIGWLDFLQIFLISDDYGFSLFGGIVGFFIMFFWFTRKKREYYGKYIDVIVLSFFLAGIIGYFGAFWGGQVYGIPANTWISLAYDTKEASTIVPFSKVPLFPLALMYMLSLAIMVVSWWKMSRKNFPDGYLGFLFLGIYGLCVFFLEFLNGSKDMLVDSLGLNFMQVLGLLFLAVALLGLLRFTRT